MYVQNPFKYNGRQVLRSRTLLISAHLSSDAVTARCHRGCVKVEVAVLGCPSRMVFVVSVHAKHDH